MLEAQLAHEHTVVKGWTLLTEASCPASGSFVYKFWCNNAAPARAIGDSRVLYVGQGDVARLRLLLQGKHHAQGRLRDFNTISRAKGRPDLEVSYWFKAAESTAGVLSDSEIAEIGLLNDFLRDHGELPLLNRKHEGWAAGRVLQALARRLSGAKTATVVDGPVAGWSMVWGKASKGGDFVLAWLWPKAWHSDSVEAPYTRGDLLLIRLDKRGEGLPTVLNPGHDNWNPESKVTARCPASALAGASAGQSSVELLGLWKVLSGGAGSLDELEGEMAKTAGGWRRTP